MCCSNPGVPTVSRAFLPHRIDAPISVGFLCPTYVVLSWLTSVMCYRPTSVDIFRSTCVLRSCPTSVVISHLISVVRSSLTSVVLSHATSGSISVVLLCPIVFVLLFRSSSSYFFLLYLSFSYDLRCPPFSYRIRPSLLIVVVPLCPIVFVLLFQSLSSSFVWLLSSFSFDHCLPCSTAVGLTNL